MDRIYLALPPEEYPEVDEAPFGIVSEEAFVAAARSSCVKCRKDIQVICIYCMSGVDTEIGNPIAEFTVSNLWAVDDNLNRALQSWPHFRKGVYEDSKEGSFANHCPHCGTIQEDYLLHSEPGDVFFGIVRAGHGAVEFTPLEGRIQVSGDYAFEVSVRK